MSPPKSLELALAFPSTTYEQMALLIAREFDRSVDVAATLSVLDELASPLAREASAATTSEDAALLLAEHIGVRLGIRGDTQTYDDPDNSFLDKVLVRKRGIPITLSVLYCAIGRRVGFEVDGIGYPGHFLVRVGGPAGTFQDPFHGGRCLDTEALEQLAMRSVGPGVRVDPAWLEPVDAKALAVRMLGNLRGAYARAGDVSRGFLAADRLVAITGHAVHRRHRGLLALGLGAHAMAVEDLSAYLDAFPTSPEAPATREALARASHAARPGVGAN